MSINTTTRRHPRTLVEAFNDTTRAEWLCGPYAGGDHWAWWAASCVLVVAVPALVLWGLR